LLLIELSINKDWFDFACTSRQTASTQEKIEKINIRENIDSLSNIYDIIFSLHCKQFFPKELVKAVKCINIHPGFNPYNRGWYPQVFSIINKLPIGATIHEMDEEIDHGKIIAQKEIVINNWETSLDVYNHIIEAEFIILKEQLLNILNNSYTSNPPLMEGNYNTISDFDSLKEIDLNTVETARYFIDRLRALSHGEFRNAFFKDPNTGKKIFIKVQLEKE